MLHTCSRTEISVVKLGKLNETVAYRAILTANNLQNSFFFNYLSESKLQLDDIYRLPNGGYDTSLALKNLSKTKSFKNIPRPLIVLTDHPIGEKEYENESGYFFFFSREDDLVKTNKFDWKASITIISTQPRQELPNRSYEDYLLMMFSTYIFSNVADLPFHEDIRGCFLDYCEELKDAENAFKIGKLCIECEQKLQICLRSNRIKIEELAAGIRLMNRAVNRKKCFVVMPINSKSNTIYSLIKNTLTEAGWTVERADEIVFPRLITSKILLEIMLADLVVAEISDNNPNVFYEVGVAHMVGNDIILMTKNDEIPFDIKNEQTIFYKEDQMEQLQVKLKKLSS